MSTFTLPLAEEIRSMYRVLREQVKRLNELAPAGIYEPESKNDTDALTWRNTIRCVSDAKVCLNDLAETFESDTPPDVLADEEEEESLPLPSDTQDIVKTVKAKARSPLPNSRKKAQIA